MGAGATESTRALSANLSGLFLARHGQTDYNASNRFQGQLSIPLNATGRRQAAELAGLAVAHAFVVLWCSPLARARETADIVGRRIGLEPIEDARLSETDAGDWTDRLWSDVGEQDPEGFAAFRRADPDFAFPGGESYRQQTVRVVDALRDIAAGSKPALVVCHAMSIRLAMAYLGRDSRPVANAGLIEL